MDCADAKLRMEPCASGALVPEELALFEEHIASCEGCRLELELVRAMGKNGEATADPKGDDWTLDRIFGAEASKGPAPPPAESAPLPIAPITAGADPAADPPAAATTDPPVFAAGLPASDPLPAAPPVEPDPHDTSMMFETTPNPMPPEAPADSASSPFGEPATPAVPAASAERPAESPIAVAAMSAEALNPARSANTPPPSEMTNAWDFEPADAKPDATLPEGSLFFAEETLARKGDARKAQNTVKRMVLWGAGAVVGLALLGVSLWLVLSAREQDADRKAAASRAVVPPAGAGAATPDSGAVPAVDGGASDTPAAGAPEVVTQPADEVVANPPAGTPRTSGPAPVLGARALTGSGVPPISTPTRSGSQQVAPRSTSGTPAATAGKGDPKKPGPTTASGATKGGTTASENPAAKGSANAPTRPPESHVPPTEDLDPEQLELRAPPPVSSTPEQNVPFAGGVKSGTATAPARGTVVVSPPPATTSESSSAAPPADQVQRPIDRLHLATVTAEQGSDLVALRKLRDTWKGLVRTSVGPDRARAKRELADCLWAVQSLTGRNSDKKNALAAYREYLLNAPAGGADPRTVARMRQLEDALAESK